MRQFLYEYYLAPFVRFFQHLGWRGLLGAVIFGLAFQFVPVVAVCLCAILLVFWLFRIIRCLLFGE